MAKMSKMARREALAGWSFILPLVIGVAIFTYGAVVYSAQISLTRWDLLTPPRLIGLGNYRAILEDQDFRDCFLNTLFFVVTLVPLGVAAGGDRRLREALQFHRRVGAVEDAADRRAILGGEWRLLFQVLDGDHRAVNRSRTWSSSASVL